MPVKKRLFIAVKVNPEQKLLAPYNTLKSSFSYDRIKWVEPDNFHLTLKFLGDTYESDIANVSSVIEDSLKRFNAFEFNLQTVGIFGSRYNPRVIWVGVEDQGQLKKMGTCLINKLDEIGFENDRQNFVPHLTIARIKSIVNKESFNATIKQFNNTFFQSVKVDRVYLYESVLTRGGPVYKVINKYLLI